MSLRSLLLGAALAAVAAPAFAAGETFETRLGPAAFDSSERAQVGGDGRVTAALSGGTARITGHFEALPGAATRARLLRGPGPGVPGAPIADLTVTPAQSGTVSGAVQLTPEQAAGFRQGQFYIQIDTAKATEGAAWGWLMPAHPFPGQDAPERSNPFAQ
jgi:hypothetical protein